jgi:hypothetical protein
MLVNQAISKLFRTKLFVGWGSKRLGNVRDAPVLHFRAHALLCKLDVYAVEIVNLIGHTRTRNRVS